MEWPALKGRMDALSESPQTSSTTPVVRRYQRTVIVWLGLLVSMTATAGLLLWLEPSPVNRGNMLALQAADSPHPSIERQLATEVHLKPERWRIILIHHSGQQQGATEQIHQLHCDLGYGGNGFHFVIGNGNGMPDGQVEAGYRWRQQRDGAYRRGAVSICLIGNGDQQPPTEKQMQALNLLVTRLQTELQLPAQRVLLHRELVHTTSPGRQFPEADFRRHLR